jgi:hypothetical protein
VGERKRERERGGRETLALYHVRIMSSKLYCNGPKAICTRKIYIKDPVQREK